jgi:hypothetical protein
LPGEQYGTSVKLPAIILRCLGERVRFLPDGKSLIYMQGLLVSQDFWLLDLASMESRPLTKLQNRSTMRTFDVASGISKPGGSHAAQAAGGQTRWKKEIGKSRHVGLDFLDLLIEAPVDSAGKK